MFGKNKKLKPVKGDGSTLEVKEIFKTFQGEGPFVGVPAIFIRLAGCNLACDFCDTDFDDGKSYDLNDLIEEINALALDENNKRTRYLAVITGGEPFRQPIEKLCEELLGFEYTVQIESNGTIYRDISDEICVINSPKNTGKGYKKLRPDVLARANFLKFIISASDPDYDHVPEVGQTKYDIPVYVQPMDEQDPEKNKKNLEYTVALADKNGYNLSLQMHKIIGVP